MSRSVVSGESGGGTLYVMATPIGNLDDLSVRATKHLEDAGLVLAEDTRRTRKLLQHLGLQKPLKSLHQHNERERIPEVLRVLDSGHAVVLVSDAGTPGVSDPGASLVAAAVEAGVVVSPLPGASALTSALSVCGFPAASSDVLFVGFVPAKGKGRRLALERIGGHRGVVVLFEAPHRIARTLEELAALDEQRPAAVCRELTKMHEEIVRGSVAEVLSWAEKGARGEITLVLGPRSKAEPDDDFASGLDAALQRCRDGGLSARDASIAVSAVTGKSRRDIYARCQQLWGDAES